MRRVMKKDEVSAFFQTLARDNPSPQPELLYTNPYTLLVAVTLSAQATDIGVNKATRPLFNIVKTPTDMVKLGEEALKKHIKTIGLYNSKAKNIIKMAEILCEKYDNKIPNNREELEKLPGVGRKTANVVLNIAFGQKTIAVDTHLFRVANRTGMAKGKTPLQVELKLNKIIPDEWKYHAHQWLILHGRYVCKARKPDCGACLVRPYCLYPTKEM